MARRSARADVGRSSLIGVLVGLPVLAGAFALVAATTAPLSKSQRVVLAMGQANAIAFVTPYRSVLDDSWVSLDGSSIDPGPASGRDPSRVQLTSLLPPGVHSTPGGWVTPTRLGARGLTVDGQVVTLDLADPLTQDIAAPLEGRAPHGRLEIDVSVALYHRLHLHLGDGVSVAGAGTRRVVGVVREPGDLRSLTVFGPAGVDPNAPTPTSSAGLPWLVDLRDPIDTPVLTDRLRAHGVLLVTRSSFGTPGPTDRSRAPANTVELVAGLAAFGLVEIVTLAGSAFAVGARRRIRDLALIAVNGGEPADLRRIMLMQSLLLGVVAAVIGIALGAGVVEATRGSLEQRLGHTMGPLRVNSLSLSAIGALGIFAAMAAAVLPARAAGRLPLMSALAGRYPTQLARTRLPWRSIVAVAAGILATAGVALYWRVTSEQAVRALYAAQLAASKAAPDAAIRFPEAVHNLRYMAALVLGVSVTMLGLVRCVPWLLLHLGRVGEHLPVSSRFAARDLARHSHRVVPAVAAVAVACTGATALVFVIAATRTREAKQYTPLVPIGDALVASTDGRAIDAANVEAAARQLLPVRSVTTIPLAVQLIANQVVPVEVAAVGTGCSGGGTACRMLEQVAIGDSTLARTLTGQLRLARTPGTSTSPPLALDPRTVTHGQIAFQALSDRRSAQPTTLTVSAVAVGPAEWSYQGLPAAIVGSAFARAHHWAPRPLAVLIRTNRAPTQTQEDAARTKLATSGLSFYVERGYSSPTQLPLVLLTLATALAAIAATSASVGLTLNDQRRDLATLAAIGASPSNRRWLAVQQSATIGVIGSTLGFALGCMLGLSLITGSAGYPLVAPWRYLLALGAAVPTLAVASAVALAPKHLPLTRRAS
jgi:putative ABC transport system permease protein